MAEKIEVVFCYAHEDEDFQLKLEKQLNVAKRQGLIDVWHNRNIVAGTEWEKEINQHLNTAHVILLLISPDFLASDYCFSVELERAMERHARGEALIIPIILRPVYWQTAPFGKLQALPAKAVPVTAWSDPEAALFNVAEGIRGALGELLLRRQARRIALFDHEMPNGRAAPRRTNPSAFLLNEAYQSWINTKRDFASHELIGQTWIKTSNPEHTFLVHFFADGSISESSLADPGNQWQGSWELLDGAVRMQVNNYELDVFANQASSVHSGIEFTKAGEEPHSYFACFPLSDVNAKHWDINAVPALVEQIFDQILHQRVNTKILITYGPLLCRGEMSIRSIVKILALSQRFRERFIDLKKIDETLEFLYALLLEREVAATDKQHYRKEIQARGSNVVIAALIDSEEYQRSFGEDTLPSNANFKPARMLRQLKFS